MNYESGWIPTEETKMIDGKLHCLHYQIYIGITGRCIRWDWKPVELSVMNMMKSIFKGNNEND